MIMISRLLLTIRLQHHTAQNHFPGELTLLSIPPLSGSGGTVPRLEASLLMVVVSTGATGTFLGLPSQMKAITACAMSMSDQLRLLRNCVSSCCGISVPV